MIAIGSGAIGMEFAYFMNAFGCDVTVVEMLDRILPVEDDDVSKAARKSFEKQGIKFKTGAMVKDIKTGKGGGDHRRRREGRVEDRDPRCGGRARRIGVKGRFDGLFDDALGVEGREGRDRHRCPHAEGADLRDERARHPRDRRRDRSAVARPRLQGRGHPRGREDGR